eukprot:TRINITY_DN5125_c0_g1_i1.p1 TRINITY_DN5125_c0_g1~~TRINITY_DN5125_c0_g1_i1.p1  ORF type:complete len:509 (+),score=88.85 TRINITY_DN5125_c0_g1_i1:42-1568(+)
MVREKPKIFLAVPKREVIKVTTWNQEENHRCASVDEDGAIDFGEGVKIERDKNERRNRQQRVPTPPRKVSYKDLVHGPLIGDGGFGTVTRVTYGNHIYALKKIYNMKASSAKAEIKLLYRAKSAFMTEMITAYHGDHSFGILLEYMQYGSLHKIIANDKKKLSVQDIKCIAASMGNGLRMLQHHHIVHRDIKPANVLVGAGGVVKLADFGVGRLTDIESSLANSSIGSTIWMAPERLMPGKQYGYPSDIYSFGLCLAWLCKNGEHPIQNNWIIQEEIIINNYPCQQLVELIRQCTQYKEEMRPTAAAICTQECLVNAKKGINLFGIRSIHANDPVEPEPIVEEEESTSSELDLDDFSDVLEQRDNVEVPTEFDDTALIRQQSVPSYFSSMSTPRVQPEESNADGSDIEGREISIPDDESADEESKCRSLKGPIATLAVILPAASGVFITVAPPGHTIWLVPMLVFLTISTLTSFRVLSCQKSETHRLLAPTPSPSVTPPPENSELCEV